MPAPRMGLRRTNPSISANVVGMRSGCWSNAKSSPVPAYMIFAFCGSMVRELKVKDGRKSSACDQSAPALVVFQRPPVAAATQMMFGLSGRTTMARTRPPNLVGPDAKAKAKGHVKGRKLKPRKTSRAIAARVTISIDISVESSLVRRGSHCQESKNAVAYGFGSVFGALG